MRVSRYLLAAVLLVALCVPIPRSMAMWGNVMVASGRGTPPITVSSLSLSNTTFPNSTANAPVGTVSVVMSDGSTFSGTLAISGANSGGFQFVGATLQTNAAGTTSGTYNDVTITATQSGASGAPSISPTLTGSAGLHCDIGPNYLGTIPAGANAVGYTHCLANLDFTSSTFSNAATFIACPGQSPASPLFWTNSVNGSVGCSSAVIATDTAGGGNQALKLTYTSADYNAGNQILELDAINPTTNTGGFTFPMGAYVDVTLRANSQTACPGCPSGQYPLWDVFWLWWLGPGGNLSTTPFVEQDLGEAFAPPITTTNPLMNTFSEWKSGCSGSPPRCFPAHVAGNPGSISGFNQTNYTTYGARNTQTAAGTFATCSYINDTQLSSSFGGGAGCASGSYLNGSSDPSITQQNTMILWDPGLHIAKGNTCGSPGTQSCDPGANPIVTWYKSILIFTCATPSSGCISSSINTSPP